MGALLYGLRALVLYNPFVGGKALPTPNQTTHKGDSKDSKKHLDMCFWNPCSHMFYMG